MQYYSQWSEHEGDPNCFSSLPMRASASGEVLKRNKLDPSLSATKWHTSTLGLSTTIVADSGLLLDAWRTPPGTGFMCFVHVVTAISP
jgi:hypothetical protein